MFWQPFLSFLNPEMGQVVEIPHTGSSSSSSKLNFEQSIQGHKNT